MSDPLDVPNDSGPSLLYPADATPTATHAPECLHDVNLDQLFAEVAVGARHHDLMPFMWSPLQNPADIRYRQAVMADLDSADARSAVNRFRSALAEVQSALIPPGKDPDAPTGPPVPGAPNRGSLDRTPEANRMILNAALRYGNAVAGLAADLSALDLHSSGMQAFRDWLVAHTEQGQLPEMMAEARSTSRALRDVHYTLTISGNTISVRPGSDTGQVPAEASYQEELEAFFARFEPDPPNPIEPAPARLDPVGIAVRERLGVLHPRAFAALAEFASRYRGSIPAPAILRFDLETSFYLAFLAVADRVRAMGLPMCYPEVDISTDVVVERGYDLALATRFFGRDVAVVTNSFSVLDPERLVVVTGPNQGGKTTFARTYAQIHWLGALGVLVPAASARVGSFDVLLTHFDRAEQVADLRGKLADDLHRMRSLLAQAGPRSLVVLNEVFASTALMDAIELSRRVLSELSARGCRIVCVTFIDELASFEPTTVSLVAGLADPQESGSPEPGREQARSFQLTRRPADGRAHARAIAARHQVTLTDIMERVTQ